VHDFLGLLYCFIVLLCLCVVSYPYVIYYPTVMARYSLFVLKVPLNPKQTNNGTSQWAVMLVTGKVTVGLASRWPCVIDITGSPPTGSWPRKGRRVPTCAF